MLLSYGAEIISTASFYSLVQLIKIQLSEIRLCIKRETNKENKYKRLTKVNQKKQKQASE